MSYMDGLWDGKQLAVQQLFCRVLLPGFVQNSMQHTCVVPIKFFFSKAFIRFQGVQPYTSTDIAIALKNSDFILSKRSDFHLVINPSIRAHAFLMLTLISANVRLQPRYVKWFTNFRSLPFNEEIAPSSLKDMITVLFEFTQRPMPHAVCFRLCSRNLAQASVFARSARLSV